MTTNILIDNTRGLAYLFLSITAGNITLRISDDWNIVTSQSIVTATYGSLDVYGCTVIIDNHTCSITVDPLCVYSLFFSKDLTKFSSCFQDLIAPTTSSITVESIELIKKYGYLPVSTRFSVLSRMGINNSLAISYRTATLTSTFSRYDPCSSHARATSPQTPFEQLCSYLSLIKRHHCHVTIPLSSGYDSRFLLLAALEVFDKTSISCFSYSLRSDGKLCFESSIARKICRDLSISWTLLDISGFRSYDRYSFSSTGATGIVDGGYAFKAAHDYFLNHDTISRTAVLSGFCGDILTGKHPRSSSLSIDNCLTKFHGLPSYHSSIDPSITNNNLNLLNNWIALGASHQLLSSEMIVIGKAAQLSFLLSCYNTIGVNVYAPFMHVDFRSHMRLLPHSEHNQRKWQSDFFNKRLLGNSFYPLPVLRSNTVAISESVSLDISEHLVREISLVSKKSFIAALIVIIKYSSFMRRCECLVYRSKFLEILLRKILKIYPSYLGTLLIHSCYRVE